MGDNDINTSTTLLNNAYSSVKPMETGTTVPIATAIIHNDQMKSPAALATLGTTMNSTVASMNSSATPFYNSLGQALPLGRGHGVSITSSKKVPYTSTGEIRDPFKRYMDDPQQSSSSSAGITNQLSSSASHHQGSHFRTLSEMKAARRMGMRADPSYDLDGDGTVSQKDYFFAVRFDKDGDGNLTLQEKLDARKIMREEENKFVFVKASGPTQSFAHRVLQKDGQVISEELDGWAALTRAKMHGTQTNMGATLPFDVEGATAGAVTITGSSGIVKEKIDVDIDDSDNVALMHTKGQVIDYDQVVVKPQYRKELDKPEVKSLSELKFKRKMKQRAPLSYDLDGDGMVSQKDYFFAVRFDKDGNGNLEPAEKAAAAEAMRTGFGTNFAFLKGSGPSDAHHRVFQHDGAIVSEETEGGWGALTKARAQGVTVRIGADGNIIENDDHERSASPVGKQAHEVMMDEAGKVALQHVQGAIIDYDTVTVKPQYRKELDASGTLTRSELLMKRRKERYPDLTMDLDGDGAVSQADYWFSKRYDVDDNNRLSPDEKSKAKKDYDEGYQKRFVTLNSSSGPGMAHRVHQINGMVISEGEGILSGETPNYDSSVRLRTLGVRPALDLPAHRLMLPDTGINRTGSLAGTYKSLARSSPEEKLTRPVANASIGIVPGVNRVILRNPDGTQESYGGYAGGMGSNPLNNMTGTLSAVMGRNVGPGSPATETIQRNVDDITDVQASPTGGRFTIGEDGYKEFHVKPDNINTFSHRGRPHEIYKQAPFALAGEGGTIEVMKADPEVASNKAVSQDMTLLTRTQLVAARRVRARTAEHSDADMAAGTLTGSVLQQTGDENEANLSVGESTLRSTIRTAEARNAHLPSYMLQSMANRSELPVIHGDLPHETVKPGALPEGTRTTEATTASALQAGKIRDKKITALELTNQPLDAVAMPELYPAGYNDHHSHNHTNISLGQDSLSKTQTQLEKRRLAERVTESIKFAPPEPYGVHKGPLPSYAKKLNSSGIPWYVDNTHVAGVTTNFMGSALDGIENINRTVHNGDASIDYRGLPNHIDPVPPEYDPSLRHTVRDTRLHGTTHQSTANMGETVQGLGSKTTRLIKDGILREDEEAAATLGDPFKTRVIHPHKLDSYLRKHGLQLPEKVSTINPWEIMKAQANDPTVFRPTFDMEKPGARPLHTIHKNASNWNNGLPGPGVKKQSLMDSMKSGRQWTSAVIEYKQKLGYDEDKNDDAGKKRYIETKDYEPLFSSFSPDRVFHDPFIKSTSGYRPHSPVADDKPTRRTSIYGAPITIVPSVTSEVIANDVTQHDTIMTPSGNWHTNPDPTPTASRGALIIDNNSTFNATNRSTSNQRSHQKQQKLKPIHQPSPPKRLVETLTVASTEADALVSSSSHHHHHHHHSTLPKLQAGVRTGGFLKGK